jgi:HK97 family phage major capsid protein/HK97 family phage prohead protease
MLYRTATLSVRAVEGADPEILVAFSSDTPIERSDWWGDRWIEILEHGKGAIDFTRAKQGLPLLLNHNTDQQVGRIENLEAGDDGVMRGTVRFSRSAQGQEVKQDVLDGIRIETSVGYNIIDRKEEQEKGKILTIRATKWMPMEGSLVPVPADYTVGVGRANEPIAPISTEEQRSMKPDSPETPAPATALAAVVKGGEDAGAVERKRVSELRALQRSHSTRVPDKKLDEWIEQGTSPYQAGDQLLRLYEGSAEPGFLAGEEPAVSSEDLEKGRYSISRAIMAQLDGEKTFEIEVHEAIAAKRSGQGLRVSKKGPTLFVPMNLWVKRGKTMQEKLYYQRGAQEVATASKGGELKFTEPGPFIEVLRNRIFVRALGARLLTGLQGDLQFPRQTGAQTAFWVPESATADVTASNMVFDNMKLSPKPLSGTNSFSRKLLAQGVADIDQLIQQDMIAVDAIEIDRAGLAGVGSNNEPMGILNASGTNSVTAGANGGTVTYDLMVDLETQQALSNADINTLAYLTNPKARGKLKKSAQISATTGIPTWWQGEVNGYRAEATNQVPSNLTKGTSTTICSAAIFARWEELIIGQWADMEFVIDPYTLAKRGDIVITSYIMVDVGLRHPASFTVIKDLLTT